MDLTDDRIGLIPTTAFVSNSSYSYFMSANGTWLDMPSAILMAKDGDETKAALLSPAAPSYDPVSRVCHWSSEQHAELGVPCSDEECQSVDIW